MTTLVVPPLSGATAPTFPTSPLPPPIPASTTAAPAQVPAVAIAPDATATVSPWAKLLNRLQHLQQNDPAAFGQVVGRMEDAVAAAANKAAGDEKPPLTAFGNELAKLAKTGDLPAFKPPKHHHVPRVHSASGGTMTLLQGLLDDVDRVLGPGAAPVTART